MQATAGTIGLMTLHKRIMAIVYEVLARHGGNKSRASTELGITPRTLRTWVHNYDELKDFRLRWCTKPKRTPGKSELNG